jgi:hypothetical protein
MLRRWPLAARGDPWDRRISELAKSGKPEENDDATHRPEGDTPPGAGCSWPHRSPYLASEPLQRQIVERRNFVSFAEVEGAFD